MLEIEKGIPMPSGFDTGITKFMRELSVGDSFLYDLTKSNRLPQIARNCGIKIRQRKQDDCYVRVWRIK